GSNPCPRWRARVRSASRRSGPRSTSTACGAPGCRKHKAQEMGDLNGIETITPRAQDAITFGPFRLDLRGKTLYRGDSLVAPGSRGLEVLCVLVASSGELVTKDALMDRVWPGLVVEENNIQVQIWSLRKALGKTDEGRDYIVTVPGRGYRFAGMPPSRP